MMLGIDRVVQAIPLIARPVGLHTNLGALHFSSGHPGAAIDSLQRVRCAPSWSERPRIRCSDAVRAQRA